MVRIRQATREDIDGMHRVRLSVRENVLSSPTRVSPSDYRASIEETGRGWVVEHKGDVVAFAVGNATDGNIWALFVHPDYEGQGLGKRLHATLVAWLRDQGLRRLWLTTEEGSRASGFYTALGWRRSCVEPNGEVRFELDVAPAMRPVTTDSEEDRSVSIPRGTLLAMPFIVLAVVGVLGAYASTWGLQSLSEHLPPSRWVVLALVASLPVHEGIHALGFLVAGASPTAVRLGVDWKTWTPYAHCTTTIPARRYRFALALPAVLLGVVPSGIGIALHVGELAVIGAWGLALASGDIVIIMLLRGVTGTALVRDHPSRFGCVVVRHRENATV